MRKVMTSVDGEKLCQMIEEQQKSKLLRPVAIIVVGMDSRESDAMLSKVAERERMETVDFFRMQNEYSALSEMELLEAWTQKLRGLVAIRKNVIVRKDFGCSVLERKLSISALKAGNPQTYIIALKLSTPFITGLNYFRDKYGKGLMSREYDYIQDSIEYVSFELDENIDCLITEVKLD